nr:peptide-methionine (R)-S-oxide reductase MsrB [uncultured Gellertiella sp.]
MDDTSNLPRNDAEWRAKLSAEQYRVLREHGTERPFTGPYWDNVQTGLYSCAGCGEQLFRSDAKFDAGCGWPSYVAPVTPGAVKEYRDVSHGMVRTEIRCGHCDGHLGHVFPDGPRPTGLRYCINGHALTFEQGK